MLNIFKHEYLRSHILLSVVILLLGAVWIGITASFYSSTTNTLIPAPKEGFLAPDFVLETIIGEPYQLSGYQGQIVLINFWASWCPPCKAEMPAMERVYRDYRNRGFVILAVNTTYQDNITTANEFALENGLTFPILMDLNGLVTGQYQVHSFPSSFFIDKNGLVDEVVIGGPMAEALLRSRVESLLQAGH